MKPYRVPLPRRLVHSLLVGTVVALALPSVCLANDSSAASVSTDVANAVSSQGDPVSTTLQTDANVFISEQGGAAVEIPRDADDPATLAGGGTSRRKHPVDERWNEDRFHSRL